MRDLTGALRTRPVVIAVGALSAVLLAAAALLLVGHDHGHPSAAARHAPTPVTGSSPTPLPTGAVTLVPGTRLADGVTVGYPHTTIGAISAASVYLGSIASTLDPDYAASLGRTVGDPANPALPGNLAGSVTALRTALQLPTDGPAPARAAFLTTPQMYQLREASDDQALVLLLTSNTFINAQGGTAGTVGVYPMRMHWTSGDWRLAGIGGTAIDYSSLTAAPGSPDAAAKGWQPLDAPAGAP